MKTKKAYCIFHECPDKQPAWHDENGLPVTFPTRDAAVREICDDAREHLRQIEDGDRELEDGIGFDDWVEEVTLHPDGTFTDSDGNRYGRRED